jgi:hypothetical protein
LVDRRNDVWPYNVDISVSWGKNCGHLNIISYLINNRYINIVKKCIYNRVS